MSKVDYIKTSFVGGEFGKSLQGRVDVAQYDNACQILENFLVRPYGPAISTPGTEFIRETKLSAASSDSTVRLLPFVFSRSDAYIIEFGESYFRFYTDGGIVVTTGTTPFELAHTYTETELFDVQFSQINDVIYLTHADHVPAKLTRLAAASWTLADFAFKGGPFLDDNVTTTTLTTSDSSGTINITASTTGIFTVSGSTTGDHDTYWRIGGVLTNSTTGLQEQGYVQITYVTDTATATASVINNLTVTGATTAWSKPAWSSYNGWPARVAFHEGRLFMARTSNKPQGIWGSKTFVYDDFLTGAEDDDGLAFELSSTESNDIKWLAPKGPALVAGTFGGEFSITSTENSPLTPTNAAARSETSWGSEGIQPKKIGSLLYYVQRFGKKIRELVFNWDEVVYKSKDMTILSPEITGDGIIDMAYQQNPENTLWCVRTDGTIATMTREIDQEVQGWARQTTAGTYETIAVIPSQSEEYDEVWVVVRRNINGTDSKRFVERFKNIVVPARQDKCFYVHSGLSYDAYNATDGVSLSLAATTGTNVAVTCSTATFAANDVGQRIRAIDENGATLGELEVTTFSTTTLVYGKIKSDFDALSYSPSRWGLSVSSLSGLDHLEATSVSTLGDGGTVPAVTVASGAITLDYDYFVTHTGLTYNQNLQTLPIDAGSRRGTSQGKIQKINQVALKVNRSYKGFLIGGTTDLIERIAFRDPVTEMGSPETLFTGVIPNITFRDDYRYGSQVYIRNSDPLPLEILQLIMTVDTADK
ncbi:MAG: hypothetical protein CMB80_02485 [Flammeovirgaceae bacterium]|nr:hypothetical protein [Flammeovirgaceae bacterium]